MENNEEFLRNRIKQGGLVSGRVCEDQFRLLVDMSSIRSEKMVQALQEYLVQGKSRIAICELQAGKQSFQHIAGPASAPELPCSNAGLFLSGVIDKKTK